MPTDGYMDAAAVPVPDAGDTMDGEFNLTAVKVLIDHQRRDAESCICDWGVDTGNLGQSHALHVWRELQAVGVTLPVPDAGDDTLREQLAQALTPLCDLPRVQHTYGNRGPCLHDRARVDALLPRIREHVAAAVQAERERRLRYQRLDVIHMQDQLRMIHALGDALGVDQNDADSCVPGCDEGAQGLEHDLHHLIERDAARRATIERVRALTVDAVESSGYDDLVRVSDIRAVLEGRCCGLHNRNCEPPSELCCAGCTEHSHPKHPEGVTCVLEATP